MLRYAHFVDKLSDRTGKALSVVTLALTGILLYEVVMRYLFNSPTIWAYETSGMLYGVCFMFGGAYGIRHKSHVMVDLLCSRLSPRGMAITDIVTAPLTLLICWVLVWYGAKGAWQSLSGLEGTSNSVWSPPFYPAKILIFVAVLLFTLQALAKLIYDVYTAISGRKPA